MLERLKIFRRKLRCRSPLFSVAAPPFADICFGSFWRFLCSWSPSLRGQRLFIATLWRHSLLLGWRRSTPPRKLHRPLARHDLFSWLAVAAHAPRDYTIASTHVCCDTLREVLHRNACFCQSFIGLRGHDCDNSPGMCRLAVSPVAPCVANFISIATCVFDEWCILSS